MNAFAESSFLIKSIKLDSNSKSQIDFNKCVICQSLKGKKIKSNIKNEDTPMIPKEEGYASLCRDFASFIECRRDSVPNHILSSFEDLNQFEEFLTKSKAVYHKQCRDEYNTQKLKRLENKCKKLRMDDANNTSSIFESIETPLPVEETVTPGTEKQQFTFDEAYSLVFHEIIRQIENSHHSSGVEFYLLSQIAKAMSERLYQMGFKSCSIHTTRLKDQLVLAIPGFRADKIGREVYLLFDENVKHLISYAISNDEKNNDDTLVKAGDILKQTFLNESDMVFSGSLNKNFCAEKTVSKTLVTFILSLIGVGEASSKIAENIAQIIQFNSVKSRKVGAAYVRHNIQREQPLPIYLALLVHSLSGKRQLVDELFEMGFSVSYSRVMDIERALASKVCEIYAQDNCVCPPNLTSGVFTTAAIDNIDHNPRSTTANYSFHGTGISLIQHHDHFYNDDYRQVVNLQRTDFSNKSKPSLPKNYYEIPSLPSIDGELPLSTVNWDPICPPKKPLEYVKNWLQRCKDNEVISWSVYNSRSCTDISSYKSTSAMLPLIKDNINSPSVVQHTIDIIIAATMKINPSQRSIVITGDQPVWTIAKQLQWLYPEKYGEDKIVLMMGGLHIEKSFLAVIGSWLEGSGWEDAIVKSGITTPGRSEGILKCDHIKRARYAHEVSLVSLSILLYETFKSETDVEDSKYLDWIETKRKESSQFQYWITTMELEAILLQYVKSLRIADFDENVSVLESMCPWYLVTDHTHYGRWLPVFVANMKQLREKNPEVYQEFKKGHFTSRQTNKKFSCISDDQLHEQNNKMVKESSSLLGMLNEETSLVKWMVSGPEIARLILEYKNTSSKSEDLRHHEDRKWFQSNFVKHVNDLVNNFRNKGPFTTTELTTIGNERKSMDTVSINNVMTASQRGSTKYRTYVLDRLVATKESIHLTIKKSQLDIFRIKPAKKINKDKMKLAAANSDSHLFCKLFIACDSRKGNVTEFFMHENNRYPPSISEFGNLRKPTSNDDVLKCLLKTSNKKPSTGIETNSSVVQSTAMEINPSALIINAYSHVQNQIPMKVMTVEEYSKSMFDKFINVKCEKYSRIDVVFDVNQEHSLEHMTEVDSGQQKYVSLVDNETKLSSSKSWFAKFLNNIKTKTQFLKILASNLSRNTPPHEDKFIFGTEQHVVISKYEIVEIDFRLPIENLITRILLHVEHAVRDGHQEILISTADYSIVPVAIYSFNHLAPNLKKLWIELVDGNSKSIISIHEVHKLHSDKADVLPFFSAFTGCSTTSAFYGIGKITAWNTWLNFPNVKSAMLQLLKSGTSLCNESMNILERFVVLMYDSKCKMTTLHDCRRVLFTKAHKPRPIDRIPPTRDALEQHVKRSILQARIWAQCLKQNIEKLEPTDWGWLKDDDSLNLIPVWTTIPLVSEHCKELTSCNCKKCTRSCTCVKNRMPCTMLCNCEGHCDTRHLILPA